LRLAREEFAVNRLRLLFLAVLATAWLVSGGLAHAQKDKPAVSNVRMMKTGSFAIRAPSAMARQM
jgi:hypothetical protein